EEPRLLSSVEQMLCVLAASSRLARRIRRKAAATDHATCSILSWRWVSSWVAQPLHLAGHFVWTRQKTESLAWRSSTTGARATSRRGNTCHLGRSQRRTSRRQSRHGL